MKKNNGNILNVWKLFILFFCKERISLVNVGRSELVLETGPLPLLFALPQAYASSLGENKLFVSGDSELIGSLSGAKHFLQAPPQLAFPGRSRNAS